MTAFYSRATTTSTGDLNVTVPFPYLSKQHIHVYVNSEEVVSSTYSWTSDSVILLTSLPDGAVPIKVQRITPADAMLTVFVAGALSHFDLNFADRQLLYMIQELIDGIASDSISALVFNNDFITEGPNVSLRYRYNLGFSNPQQTAYDASQVLGSHKFAANVSIPIDFGDCLGWSSQAGGTVNATTDTTIRVQQAAADLPNSWTDVGTIVFTGGTVTPTFAAATALAFSKGDVIQFIAQEVPDDSFAGFYCTIVGLETQ